MRADTPSRTAQYVALVRTVLHERGDLDDPHAVGMLGSSMRLTAAAFRRPPLRAWTSSPFFAALGARIAFFDSEVRSAIDAGVGQVVIVGAGYDSRAWRLARPGVRFFELDHPATQADKRRRAPAGEGPTYVTADLATERVADALAGTGFEAERPALFVLEGLTMYLTEDQVRNLLGQLSVLSAPGSVLAVNFGARPGTGGPVEQHRQRLVRLVGRMRGEAHHFLARPSEVAPLLASAGWPDGRVVLLRDAAPGLLGPTDLRIDKINPEAAAVVASRPPR